MKYAQKLNQIIHEDYGHSFQYMDALGIDVGEFVSSAIKEKLDAEYSDLVTAAEKRLGLPLTVKGNKRNGRKSLSVVGRNLSALGVI